MSGEAAPDLFGCQGHKTATLERIIFDTEQAISNHDPEAPGTAGSSDRPGLKVSTLEQLLNEAKAELSCHKGSGAAECKALEK